MENLLLRRINQDLLLAKAAIWVQGKLLPYLPEHLDSVQQRELLKALTVGLPSPMNKEHWGHDSAMSMGMIAELAGFTQGTVTEMEFAQIFELDPEMAHRLYQYLEVPDVTERKESESAA